VDGLLTAVGRRISLVLAIALVFAQIALGQAADGDGDGVRDDLDNCVAWKNDDQADSDGNGRGDACECGDQDGSGLVDVADLVAINLAIFDPALATPLCDASGDGECDVADIVAANLRIFGRPAYCPRHPVCADRGAAVSGSCNADIEPGCTDPFEPGSGFAMRVDADSSLAFPASDGCSLTPSDLPGFPSDGDVNNPAQEVMSSLGVSCPGAAFGTFRKPGAVCGVDVSLEVCGQGHDGRPCFGESCDAGSMLGAPCSDDGDCPDGECKPAPFCGDPDRPRACEQHDSCGTGGTTCGYRQKQCDNQFRRNLFRTCYSLRGAEASCLDACLAFAAAYAARKDGRGPDDGAWSQSDLEHQRAVCTSCPGLDDTTGLPAVCGDAVCRRDLGETCTTCPECCGLADGGVCQVDTECESGACMQDGRCGRLPEGAPCLTDASCASGACTGGQCCAIGSLCNLFCAANTDCASGICNWGRCIDGPLPDFTPCSTSAACASGSCTLGLCTPLLLPDGSLCLDDASCESGICNLGFCLGAPLSPGSVCSTSSACADGNGGVGECVGGRCVQACSTGLCNGSPCLQGENCASGHCSLLIGCVECSADAHCASGACAFNRCYPAPAPDGSPCDSAADCQSDRCEFSVCGGEPCLSHGDCSGLGIEICNFGFCLPFRLPNGSPCSANGACSSGTCNAGTCIASNSLGAGSVCTTNSACISGSCSGVCLSRCGDGRCDGTEICGNANSGLECNSDCGKCANGLPCLTNSDCQSDICVLLLCRSNCRGLASTCSSDSQCCSGDCAPVLGVNRCVP